MTGNSQIKINPQKMNFCEKSIKFSTLERAFSLYKKPNDIPPLTYAKIDEFTNKNNNSSSNNMLIHIQGAPAPMFFTIIKKSYQIKIQYYRIENGFNKNLYTLTIDYPSTNRENYEDNFFQFPNDVTTVYGLLCSLERYYRRWIL